MKYFQATVKDPVGLHARPASVVVQAAKPFESEITIHAGAKSANLKSILNVMALAVSQGTEIKVEAVGKDAEEAIKTVKKAMQDNNLI